MMLLSILIHANENNYEFIFRDENGRYYLTDETVLELANYIKRLEDLNMNYKKQIANLEQQIKNLEEQIANLEQQIKVYENVNLKLQKELEKEIAKKYIWTVVSVITVGATIILFLK